MDQSLEELLVESRAARERSRRERLKNFQLRSDVAATRSKVASTIKASQNVRATAKAACTTETETEAERRQRQAAEKERAFSRSLLS